MRSKVWMGSLMVLMALVLLVSFSCAPKATTRTDTGGMTQQIDPNALSEEELARRAAEEAALAEQNLAAQRTQAMQAARDDFENEDIRFDFDTALLSFEAQAILRAKAQFLKENMVNVLIEGHCDERGTNEYNLALGDRRARSAKAFLMDLGIAGDRIRTISYGEEKPLDPAGNEEAWAKNRRAHFVIN